MSVMRGLKWITKSTEYRVHVRERTNLERNMPSTSTQAEDHPYWEEDSPDEGLETHVDPQDRVYGRSRMRFVYLVMMLVGPHNLNR